MSKQKFHMGVQQVLLKPDQETESVLKYLCEQSGKLYNTGVYFARQTYFKTGRILTGKFDLDYEPTVSKTVLFRSLPSTPAQQTLRSVVEAFKSFKGLLKSPAPGQRPKVPGYLTGSKLYKVAYPNGPKQGAHVAEGCLKLSLGKSVKAWFGLQYLALPLPSNLDPSKVKEWTILPKNGSFYLEASYFKLAVHRDLDPSQALGVDLGTSSSIAACVGTDGSSFLVDAKFLKAANQLWNKKVSTRKEGKEEGYWDSWLDRATRKRNHQMRDGINKTAKLIVDRAISSGLGTIVMGWGEGFKTSSNMGRINNQKFVQIPLAKLRDRVKQLCELNDIQFLTTEEAYTSKASFLDSDSLPKFGEKPDGWQASGRRVKRGLYRSGSNALINADLNGAANILRKVAGTSGICLDRLSRRCLASVAKIRINPVLSAESQSL